MSNSATSGDALAEATVPSLPEKPARKTLAEMLRRRTSSGAYFPEIDGLRFLAIAPVVLQHLSDRVYRAMDMKGTVSAFDQYVYSLVPSGYLGVRLFFVISGYIICMPLAKRATAAPQAAPEFHYGTYMLRRVTRLEVPYLLLLGLIFLAVMAIETLGMKSLTEGTVSYSATSIPLPLSFAASLVYAHGVLFRAFPRLNPPAWSLEIEFQFYLIAPAIILLCLAVGRWFRSFTAVWVSMVVAVIAMKLAAHEWASTDAHRPTDLENYLVSKFVEFFVLGFVLSFLYARGTFKSPTLAKIATPLFLGGIALAWYADHVWMKTLDAPAVRILSLIAFSAIFAGALSGGVGRRFTSATWIATIGGMCYSIYLIHLMLFQAGTRILLKFIPMHDLVSATIVYGLILIPLTLVACSIFFILIEKPCMDPQWPQKLYRAIRGFFTGQKDQVDVLQKPDATA